ncbi:cytochrome P450 4C1 isoform X2 [Planococcus citri]|uniref:cytochrome P450 4C1 isoform X2 n=1 Tax=Planococcus citri TaxID=170843 RepID=UPI0031F91193
MEMDLVLTTLISILIIIPLYYFLKAHNKKQRIAKYIDKLPGPKAMPLFGNVLQLKVARNKLFKVIDQRTKRFSPLFRSWVGPVPFVHILRPEHAEIIMSSSKHIEKSLTYKFLYPWLGTGLLTSSGSKWHSHRKMITPTFHFKILDIFFEVMQEKVDILVNRLKEKCHKPPFDVYPYITLCALDIICETAMGVPIDAQKDLESEYVKAIYEISELTIQRTIRPWMWPVGIFKWTEMGKKYFKSLRILHGFSRSVIRERKEFRRNVGNVLETEKEDDIGTKKRLAFLDLLLQASADGMSLTDEEIREEVDTFMFEGHDTTTASICWVLYLLGSHPEHQEKVVEELDSIFGDSNRAVTLRDMTEMKYLERVIKETLRLFPSVPFIGRTLNEDVTIENYVVPKGTHLNIQLYHIHRCPDQFPNPEQFNPDNFLPENVAKRHPYSYVPFSAGPRNCIGQKFALMEEKTMLSQILRYYKVEAKEKFQDMNLMNELVLRPENGIILTISERKK